MLALSSGSVTARACCSSVSARLMLVAARAIVGFFSIACLITASNSMRTGAGPCAGVCASAGARCRTRERGHDDKPSLHVATSCRALAGHHATSTSSWTGRLPGAIVRIATYSTGMKMIDRNVDASMPPATAVPTELRAPDPAPVA